MQKLVLLILVFSLYIYANENIDNILSDIEHKSDLSQKTKIANAGISFIYTRDDLNRMQAKYLKDILKSSYLLKYFENRYNIPDPFTQGNELVPFKSSTVRIYIDNQEISTGLYGSGLVTYGDLDIGFIDHIEIYNQNPTYEYSTEATYILIKMYSKSILKDEGSKIEFNARSYGANRISGYTAQNLGNNWSHLTYLSYNNDKRDTYYSKSQPLSRDKKVTHLFSSIKNTNNRILIDITKQQKDAFIAQSADATPDDADLDLNSIHIGYDSNFNNFSFLISYDYSETDFLFKDANSAPIYEQSSSIKSNVFTTGIKYNFITNKNKLTTGIKYRNIYYNKEYVTLNNTPLPQPKTNTQTISTIFAENKYSIEDNKILTFGLQVSDVKNNHSEQDDTLFMYRLGFTYIYNQWTSKTIISHNETALEPYLVDKYDVYITQGTKHSQEFDYITQNFIYEKDTNRYEFILNLMRFKNSLLQQSPTSNLLDNYKESIYLYSTLLRLIHNYNRYDKLTIRFGYKETDNIPTINNIKNYTALIRNLNTYKNFDFFSELIFNRDTLVKKNFYDFSLGIKYNYNKDLILSLKGENIFDKAEETIFTRTDSSNFQPITPLFISPIDRKITFSVEYYF